MNPTVKRAADGLLRITRLQYWPVTVKSGLAAGARWTLYPWSSYWRGTQEPVIHRAFAALGDITGWSCWDLGAHYGIYSIGLARSVGPTGEVAAFEPNPLSFARLERHQRMNQLTHLKLFNAAISDQPAELELYTYGELESTSTHLPYDDEKPTAESKPVRVQALALDHLVAAGKIRAPRLMKVDVEGHGHRAIAGSLQTIRDSLPIIVMGFHSSYELEGTRRLLEPIGYHWEPIEVGRGDDALGDYMLRPQGRS